MFADALLFAAGCGIGWFIAVPLWLFLTLLLLMVGSVGLLAVDEFPNERQRSRMSTTWRRIRRFFHWRATR